jgi:glycosyltransferase involved in cell wall biosynthesis
MKILFIDPVCPKPYTVKSLETGRMGGTEATVIRVMKALSARYEVEAQQRGRENTAVYDGISYGPIGAESDATHIVVLRDAKVYREARELHPTAKHYLWLHDVVAGEYAEHLLTALAGVKSNVICVSQWHQANVFKSLYPLVVQGLLKFHTIYNPVAEYCVKSSLPYDPKKLIYFSSPHKGLNDVLELFRRLHKHDPKFKLLVANPGYYEDKKDLPDGVTALNVPHKELMQEIATSLCVFYPQATFEETFGLVYAESNALGTPVLAHNLGAAPEILDNPKQMIPVTVAAVLDTVQAWSNGERPTVGPYAAFSLPEVTKDWVKLLRFE